MAKKVSDMLALGNLLVSIFVIILAWRETSMLIKIIGVSGGLILGYSQAYYLWNFLNKK